MGGNPGIPACETANRLDIHIQREVDALPSTMRGGSCTLVRVQYYHQAVSQRRVTRGMLQSFAFTVMSASRVHTLYIE